MLSTFLHAGATPTSRFGPTGGTAQHPRFGPPSILAGFHHAPRRVRRLHAKCLGMLGSVMSFGSGAIGQTCCQSQTDYPAFLSSCPGNRSQVCPGPTYEVSTCGSIRVEYTAADHCSLVGVFVYVDGELRATSAPLGPGQASGLLELGVFSAGTHQVHLVGYGVVGGCNIGALQLWGGTTRIVVNDAAPGSPSGPASVQTCPFGIAVISLTPNGTGPFAYQWRKDAIAIDTTANPSAATATLTLTNVGPADEASYDCIVTNACGSVTSDAATLTICAADFNCDGFLDFFDYDAFVECFETEVCSGGTADFNADGFVDFFDYDDFVAAFETGC
jgi:hypothetical protein